MKKSLAILIIAVLFTFSQKVIGQNYIDQDSIVAVLVAKEDSGLLKTTEQIYRLLDSIKEYAIINGHQNFIIFSGRFVKEDDSSISGTFLFGRFWVNSFGNFAFYPWKGSGFNGFQLVDAQFFGKKGATRLVSKQLLKELISLIIRK